MWDETSDSDANEDSPYKKFKKMEYQEAIVGGRELYNYWGGKVIEHTTASGERIALKVKPRTGLRLSEAAMMQYAHTHGILAPRVRAVYDVQTKPTARVMVTDRVPGVPLKDIWPTATPAERASYTEQLRVQLARMRECTQPWIGGLDRDGQPCAIHNIYERLLTDELGPFHTEKEFDEWCRLRTIPKCGWYATHKWKRFLERGQRKSSGRFVLTHGDLAARNIMARDGVITGIVDWQRAGFYPEYAEYAFAMELSPGTEKWFLDILKEILPKCSKDRRKFTKLVEAMGYVDPDTLHWGW